MTDVSINSRGKMSRDRMLISIKNKTALHIFMQISYFYIIHNIMHILFCIFLL